MIVVNYYQAEDYNPDTDGYTLTLAGVINDNLDLHDDIAMIIECIDNDVDFEPKNGVMYEIYLDRANIQAPFPAIDPHFQLIQLSKKNIVKISGITRLLFNFNHTHQLTIN